MNASVSVVVPTLGRSSLTTLLKALGSADIIVVDDRPDKTNPLPVPDGVTVLPGPARGPAAARNVGWRAARRDWIAFLDDDVVPDSDWLSCLSHDVGDAPREVGGVQGNVRVPLPSGRRPTDWERVTAALADGAWITADMAYRRAALTACGGFDERLPRAFREDAELAFRVRREGWSLRRGTRWVTHPVRAESPWVSLRTQRGNADDALLRHLYGRSWRTLLEIPPGRRRRHAVITAAGAIALAARRKPAISAAAGMVWLAGTAEFARERISPGPRNPREVAAMLATSIAIPPIAVAHWLRGWWRWRDAAALGPHVASPVMDKMPAKGAR